MFKVESLSRKDVHWEDYLMEQTPVEKVGEMYFKREDKFSPLGQSAINGSKLRQCIWLIDNLVKQGYKGVVSGAVTGSPQHYFVPIIAAHYGVRCIQVTGGKPSTKYATINAAQDFGAEVVYSNPGYAATLNAKAKDIAESRGYYHLETNITVNHKTHSGAEIEAFHRVGSEQVKNIPDNIETLMIPAGSCNSVVSVLYGISRFLPKGLKRVVLFGIGAYGSKDPSYVYERMATIDPALPFLFKPNFVHDKPKEPMGDFSASPYELVHFNVNNGCGACEHCEKGFCTYNDLLPATYRGIVLHPRYEGKAFNFMSLHKEEIRKHIGTGDKLFWIVGGEVDNAVLNNFLP